MKKSPRFMYVTILVTLVLAAMAVPASAHLIGLSRTSQAVPAPSADAQVSVAHLAPFANSPLGTSVTVRVNGGDAIQNFEYGDIQDVSLAPGNYLIEILPTGSSTVAISGTFTLAADTSYTLAAMGDGANQPLELAAYVKDTTPDASNAKLFIGHLAPFANTLPGTQVDICTDDGAPILTNFAYKGFTDPYLTLPAGDYNLKITVAGTNCSTVALDLPSIRLAAGEIVDVFAIGGANTWPLNVASTTGFNLTPARVSVAHLAPFASEVISTSVTVRVNGGDALTDFTFGDITDYLDFAPGTYLIEILPTGTNTVAISGTFNLTGAMDYTLAAIGDGTNQPLELFALVDDNSAPAAGNARLRIAHFAPFANTIDATRVDICTDSGTAVVSDVPYKGFTDPYLSLPAGLYNLKVTAAGSSCNTMIFDIPPVILKDGMGASVYAIGGANGWAPTVLPVPDIVAKTVFLPVITR